MSEREKGIEDRRPESENQNELSDIFTAKMITCRVKVSFCLINDFITAQYYVQKEKINQNFM